MGASLSSPTFASLAYLKNGMTPAGTFAGITRFRINLSRAVSNGQTLNCYGSPVLFADARMLVFVVCFLLNYNTIGLGKFAEDTMNTIIDKRHGYDTFRAYSSQEQARIKAYTRSEWLTGMNLPEQQRYSPDVRIGLSSNAAKIQ
ncbi:hypothetical protein DIPPA_03039 [Diplonema papillatum]|nr:hypothetical protein DIPPA_03039 [Diplonema papillatum]